MAAGAFGVVEDVVGSFGGLLDAGLVDGSHDRFGLEVVTNCVGVERALLSCEWIVKTD